MTLLTDWIQTPAARALGWTLFHFLWEGIAIAALLAVALVFVRGARGRYVAGCLALAAMLAACAVTFVRVLPEQRGTRSGASTLLPPPVTGPDSPADPRTPFHAEDLLPWAAPVW